MKRTSLWFALALTALAVIVTAGAWAGLSDPSPESATVSLLIHSPRQDDALNAVFRVTLPEAATLSYGWDNSRFGGGTTMVHPVPAGEYTIQVLRWFDGSGYVALEGMQSRTFSSLPVFYKLESSRALSAGGITFARQISGRVELTQQQTLWLIEATHPSGFIARFGVTVGKPLSR